MISTFTPPCEASFMLAGVPGVEELGVPSVLYDPHSSKVLSYSSAKFTEEFVGTTAAAASPGCANIIAPDTLSLSIE
jgi:hypothetical protein